MDAASGFDTQIEQFWNERRFTCTVADGSEPCLYAMQFQSRIDSLFLQRLEDASPVTVNQLKLFLLDRYFDFRRTVPVQHRSIYGGRRGHRCIFAVFEEAYGRLRDVELDLVPPPLERVVAAKARPSEPMHPFKGMLLGTLEPDPEFGPGWNQ